MLTKVDHLVKTALENHIVEYTGVVLGIIAIGFLIAYMGDCLGNTTMRISGSFICLNPLWIGIPLLGMGYLKIRESIPKSKIIEIQKSAKTI